ncbi:PAS domain S-box protein [Domibacillus sp. PGB-M46]|uniref:PAS domain S-box protein n=1 Tax=Domibacillus sp. PGB-M46 TaxID=2910255 RepID=UPI001F59A813|nr:EAL domain-containing protein [Domibacillus sp. PGB-M46]MCI2256056.1 PAS domain S-box protein [Domibacillus sp. PGB-M46]
MELMIGLGVVILILFTIIFLQARIQKKWAEKLLDFKKNEQYYQSLYQQNPDLVITFDLEGNFLDINKTIELYGYTSEEMLHQSFIPYIVPGRLQKTLEHFQIAAEGKSITYETAIFSKSGDIFEIRVTNIPIIINDQIVGVYGIHKDITVLNQTQAALTEAESHYRSLAEESVVGIYIIQDEVIMYVNQKMAEMLGYTKEELIGSNVMNFIHTEDRIIVNQNLGKRLEEGFSNVHYQYRAIKKDQTLLHLEVLGSKTTYKGKPAITGTLFDITARKKAEEKIEYLAYHDALTGLSNRYQFYTRLKNHLLQETTKGLAVLMIDLDRFKFINDSLGQETGDRLIQKVSERLKNCMDTEEDLARNGSDEFLISLCNMNRQEVSAVAERILASFTKPFQVDQYELYSTPSIGISFYPHDGKDVDTLIKKADSALHQVKRNGKNHYQFYDADIAEHTYEKWEIETDLRKALEQEELLLHYQPKVDLSSGKVAGAEALLRWQHPEKGLVSPAAFIPLAEETGLIIPIGEWILYTACAQNKAWQEAGLPPMVISVNLSVRQLYKPDLVGIVRRILKETDLSPQYLELEITESMLMDMQQGLKILEELKKIGVQISMDDFGTGYSSLHYLKALPIDKLKIDQSFIRNCTADSNDAAITKTIITMAHQLKMKVVAEGVESKDQLAFLQRHLCNEGQGYLFSKPVPAAEFAQKIGKIEQIIPQNGIPTALSDQMWMEEALETARQELLDTVRQQQGMIFKFVEEDGLFIHTLCDGELLYRLGLLPEQVVGKKLSDFLPSEAAEQKNEHYQRAWNGQEHATYEGIINGVYYAASLRPIRRSGQVVEVIGSCIDITERKQVEEALKRSEANYRLITDNMEDLIRVLDVDGTILYASPSHETVLGYPPEFYEGKSIFDRVHPDDISDSQREFLHMISTQKPSQFEFRMKHANGDWVYVDSKKTPVLGENGEIERIIVVARDISERKKTEEFIRRTEKLAVAGQLAAGVAHEIRTPLTSLKGFLQLMRDELDDPGYTDIMLSEISNVEKVVDEFLAFVKPQVSKVASIDINMLLDHVMTLASTQAALKSIQIVKKTDAELPDLYCDGQQIKRVFIHILQNAVEATSNGGIIKIQTVRHGPDHIKFRFIDQGHGISEDRMKSIGEPFYGLKEKGTGLGLMISHKIIEEHGGNLHLESIVNKGTVVEVILPLNQLLISETPNNLFNKKPFKY